MRRIEFKTRQQKNRRGVAIVWLILWGSLFLTFFCAFFEVATLWQARVELNDTLDAAALAAVNEWKAQLDASNSDTEIPREVGMEYAGANLMLGTPVSLSTNYGGPGDLPYQNDLCTGNFVFGDLTTSGSGYNFSTSTTGGLLAVRAQATKPVYGFCSAVFGVSFFNVSAASTAFYDTVNGEPRLVHITSYSCSN
jgi:Flp pilus assembly protein TadG